MTMKEILRFAKTYVEKHKFHSTKEPVDVKHVNISNK